MRLAGSPAVEMANPCRVFNCPPLVFRYPGAVNCLRLLAELVAAAALCPIPRPGGAFEPWACNTDPTDGLKRHVQEITISPFTYTIGQGGTLDGKKCTTLPGVWVSYEQVWESNRSLRMENIGDARFINPWLANELDLVRDHDPTERNCR